MVKDHFNSAIAVISVTNYETSRNWNANLLGEPALEPEPSTGEWTIGSARLQITENSANAGYSVAILGVSDIHDQVSMCQNLGHQVSEIQVFGFIKLAELTDPDGNKLQLVEEVPEN